MAKITGKGGNYITVGSKDFYRTPDTEVIVNGSKAGWGRIKVGMKVIVGTKTIKNGKRYASRISARIDPDRKTGSGSSKGKSKSSSSSKRK